MKSIKFTLPLFCILLLLVSCTSTALNELDAIVSTAEIVLPVIPGLSPTVAAAITTYVDAALKITDDVLATSGNNAQAVAVAVADFNKLAVPQIDSSVSPQAANLINALVKAVSNFVNTYQASAHAGASLVSSPEPKKISSKPLTEKEKKKAVEIRKRLAAARAKLKSK